MSCFGCPERQSKGWTEGYISITFKHYVTSYNYTILRHVKESENEKEYQYQHEKIPDADDKYIFHPVTADAINLRFCFKNRENSSLDIGSFPKGIYSIYADESGCKEGNSI